MVHSSEEKNTKKIQNGNARSSFLFFLFVNILFAGFLVPAAAEAATGLNNQINFQGKVVNTDGTNVANASYSFLFCIYTTASPATACTSGANNDAVWRESKSITVTDGIFQTSLGDTTTLPGSVDFNTDNIYLGVNFNSNGQMTPLVRFTAAPYAMNADKVHGLSVTDTTGILTIPNGKTIQFGDAFTTTGAFPLTLTATASTTATLPSGTITLADLTTSQTLTNKIIGSTGLTFTGAATDITTGTGEDLTVVANGAGIISLNDAVTISGTTTLSGLSAGGVVSAAAGTGVLSVGTLGASSITANALDFTEFKDSMTLDASTDISVTGTNVFSVTNSGSGNSLVINDAAGDTTPFLIDAAGNVGIGDTTPDALLDLDFSQTSGSLFGIAAPAATTLVGSLTGLSVNLSSNVTATGQSIDGGTIALPAVTNTGAGTYTYRGLHLTSGALTQNTGAGTSSYTGYSVTTPNITQTTGSASANGFYVTTGSITTGGTQRGINIAASGVGAGTLQGINFSGITAGAGTETALAVGSGWDTILDSTTLDITGAGAITGATGLTFASGGDRTISIANVVGGNNLKLTASNDVSPGGIAGDVYIYGGNDDSTGGDVILAHTGSAARGNVGIGDVSPAALLTVGNGDLFQVNSSGAITAAAGITSSGVINANGGISLAGSQSLSAAALSFVDLSSITQGSTANQGLRLPNAASATPSNPTSGEGYLAWDAAGNQLITYNGSSWATVGGGSTTWNTIGDAVASGAIAMGQTAQTMDWVMASDAAVDGLTFTFTNGLATDTSTQNAVTFVNLNDSAATGTLETMVHVDNRDINETVTNGLLVEQTGAGTITNALNILETAGTITTGINIGNNIGTGIAIGTGATTGISVGSGGITIAAGALAVNSDSITSDGALVINATSTDIQDILNVDSLTTDTSGVTIVAGGSYTGAGAVTLSSAAASGLTVDSGTTGALDIGTGANAKTITLGNATTSTTVNVNSGTGGINLVPEGTAEGTVQIGTGGAGSTTPDLLALDTKSDAGDPATAVEGAMYYNQSSNKFRCYQNTGWADCIGAGGGGSPGGVANEVQYNDGAGGFAGAANIEVENGYLRLPVTSVPASVAVGGINLYARSVGGRLMPGFVGPSGLDVVVQPNIGRNKIAWWSPAGNSTTITATGAAALTATGTATAANVATTNRYTQMKKLEYLVTTAATTAVAGFRNGAALYHRGAGAGDGGFHFICTWGPATGVATTTNRAFIGMTSATTAPTDVQPSSLTNMFGFGWDAADTNIQFMTNDGTGTATKTDLGANFPVPTVDRTKMYETIIFAAPNGSTIGYKITDLSTGSIAEGTVSTDLVANTTLLAPRGWMSVGGTSSVIGIALSNLYIETDF